MIYERPQKKKRKNNQTNEQRCRSICILHDSRINSITINHNLVHDRIFHIQYPIINQYEWRNNMKKVTIPIYNDNDKIIGLVEFEDNLTLVDSPDYVNMNGRMGLKRLGEDYGVLQGELVLMFYDPYYPKTSFAEIVTEREAFDYCQNRGKLELASELGLKYVKEIEVTC